MKPVDHFYSAIDCSDPINLANFYSSITGLKVDITTENTDSNIVWVELKDNQGIPKLAFQKVSNYKAPTWPEGPIPQQLHLDFAVKDLDETEIELLKIGAVKTEFQPGSPKSNDYSTEFRVYLDPEGHPFCIIHRP
ncbi:MAG: VOC family protein [Actinomycetes bacterium]